jgi:hypothetical protein
MNQSNEAEALDSGVDLSEVPDPGYSFRFGMFSSFCGVLGGKSRAVATTKPKANDSHESHPNKQESSIRMFGKVSRGFIYFVACDYILTDIFLGQKSAFGYRQTETVSTFRHFGIRR